MSSQKLILMSSALLLLGGCGGEDNSSSQTSSSIMAPLAGDAFEVLSKNDGQTTVSLKDVVIDPQGLPLTLESVVATGQACEAPTAINAQALTFTVDNAKPELCFYRYSVKNHPAQASLAKASEANSYVLKSASSTSLLSPLSETTQVGTPITVSIAAVAGYTLDSEVAVLGDGGAVADSTASTITYTPNAQGVTRLIYTMTSDDDTDMMTGTIDVAVSDEGNTAPAVVPVELTTQPGDAGLFNINESYTIGLSYYVSDADGDDVQLIQVQAWNASVALAASEDTSNLSFTFQTSEPGAHYVTYLVSDHRGGYGVEQVRIEAYDLSSVATWDDIQKGAKLFSAPLTQSEALISEVAFTSSHIDSNDSNVATFSFAQAQSLCESKGHLPTSEDLAELYGFEGGPASTGKDWPVDIAYWANDGGTAALVNLASGAVETEIATSGHYVTCLNEGGFVIDTASSDVEAVANNADEATIVVKLTFNGNPVEGQSIDASTTNTNVTFNATSGTTDNNGSASFALSSLVAEEVPVSITYSGETLTQNVTFIADESTSKLSLEVPKNSAVGDGTQSNIVEAVMVDFNNNPVVGRTVTFESDAGDSVTITPAESTDANGRQEASAVWSGDALTEDTPVNITARFTPLSTGTEISATEPVMFTSSITTICGGVVDDTSQTNAAGNCLKVSTDAAGNWFTSSPSIAVMDSLGYAIESSDTNSGKTYAEKHTETGAYGPAGEFARFRQDGDGDGLLNPGDGNGTNEGTNGQLDRWCQNLRELEFAGKASWRRPMRTELEGLYAKNGNMWDVRGWPTNSNYWSSTVDGLSYNDVSLNNGDVSSGNPSNKAYASCIAPPPLEMCGTGVNDSNKDNATGYCLKVAEDDDGNWFTSTPSIAVMDSLGYELENSDKNSGKTYAREHSESSINNGPTGKFARFRQDGDGVVNPGDSDADGTNEGTNGQFDRWCQDLKAMGFAGKNDWHRPTRTELEALYTDRGALYDKGMWESLGWPANLGYLSSTVDGSGYNYSSVNLSRGGVPSYYPQEAAYAPCVSNP